MSLSLYELSIEYQELMERMELLGDDEWTLDEEEFTTAMDQLDREIHRKADGICGVIRGFESKAAFWKAESKRMADGAEFYQHQADRLRRYLLTQLMVMGMNSLDTNHFRVRVRSTPSINVFDEEAVPPEFIHTETISRVDKLAIRAHLKEGGEMPGGVDQVHTASLVIK